MPSSDNFSPNMSRGSHVIGASNETINLARAPEDSATDNSFFFFSLLSFAPSGFSFCPSVFLLSYVCLDSLNFDLWNFVILSSLTVKSLSHTHSLFQLSVSLNSFHPCLSVSLHLSCLL